MHRKEKRAYQKKVQDELASACKEDQMEFWKRVKKTGIASDRKFTLPLCVKDDSGQMVTGEQEVQEEWEKHFNKLHNGSSGAVEEEHHARIGEELPRLERIPADSDKSLNVDISYSEVRNS